MNRGAGTGLIGLGIVFTVIGAILDWAVTVTTTGLNINSVGVILLVVGICSIVIGGAVFVAGSRATRQPERAFSTAPMAANASWNTATSCPNRVLLNDGGSGPSSLVGLGPQGREGDHVPYRFRPGEQHYETVDADTEPTCRW